ncbi:alpha-L-arabinofuranosidase C-terminal domain-containing protein [Alteromonas sp. 1_MG-2023]|uniref:alpha-N-arabinofuranosidase n=1 Tax=Alteromonas sp. 1_MG-2023 TaxID=3062669 RepID=UPI0026E178E5|nr:alpha-L-arabinofuranosidase C-terminal domain-containing protein [Alteromonas sp. 1_MG-2023]MDO6474087.1 alpha-L-arabinofuranosidase C-terminal domain-containing protein [Alteromonas sp. 1_MG-2023]
MKFKYSLIAAAGLFCTTATADDLQGTVSKNDIDVKISKNIYGQFAEHLGNSIYEGIWVGKDSDIPNTRGIRNDVVAALKEIKVPVVRWPGGCFADEYDWRDGIGDPQTRPMRKNNWWGGTPEPNSFGTHEFFDFAEQIGADAYVSVNVASSTPMAMREWIEYMTSTGNDDLAQERRKNGRDEPFDLKFVGIGNESWGCGGFMTPEYYANRYRRFASFFHKNGSNFHMNNDNKAVRVASGANNLDTNWTDTVMTSAGSVMDAISLHFYTLHKGNWPERDKAAATGFNETQWNGILYQASRMEDVLNQHEAVMDRIDPEKRISLYVDEWGTWYAPEKGTNPAFLYQQNTLRDALVAGITFNIFHQHADRVGMANIAQAVNVLQAMILTDGADMAKTPTFYAFRMFTPFQESTRLDTRFTSPVISSEEGDYPAVTLSAATTKQNETVIGLTNTSLSESHTITLSLKDIKGSSVSGEILTHSVPDAHNVPGEQEQVAPAKFNGAKIKGDQLTIELPAKSVVVLKVK